MIVPVNEVNPAEDNGNNMDVEKAPLRPSGRYEETKAAAAAAAVSEAEGSSDSGSDLVCCFMMYRAFLSFVICEINATFAHSLLPNVVSVPHHK